MYTMSQKTKKAIEETVGLTPKEISTMSVLEEKKWVEKRINKKLVFSRSRRQGVIGRGSPLLSRKKIRTMAYVDNKISKITGNS